MSIKILLLLLSLIIILISGGRTRISPHQELTPEEKESVSRYVEHYMTNMVDPDGNLRPMEYIPVDQSRHILAATDCSYKSRLMSKNYGKVNGYTNPSDAKECCGGNLNEGYKRVELADSPTSLAIYVCCQSQESQIAKYDGNHKYFTQTQQANICCHTSKHAPDAQNYKRVSLATQQEGQVFVCLFDNSGLLSQFGTQYCNKEKKDGFYEFKGEAAICCQQFTRMPGAKKFKCEEIEAPLVSSAESLVSSAESLASSSAKCPEYTPIHQFEPRESEYASRCCYEAGMTVEEYTSGNSKSILRCVGESIDVDSVNRNQDDIITQCQREENARLKLSSYDRMTAEEKQGYIDRSWQLFQFRYGIAPVQQKDIIDMVLERFKKISDDQGFKQNWMKLDGNEMFGYQVYRAFVHALIMKSQTKLIEQQAFKLEEEAQRWWHQHRDSLSSSNQHEAKIFVEFWVEHLYFLYSKETYYKEVAQYAQEIVIPLAEYGFQSDVAGKKKIQCRAKMWRAQAIRELKQWNQAYRATAEGIRLCSNEPSALWEFSMLVNNNAVLFGKSATKGDDEKQLMEDRQGYYNFVTYGLRLILADGLGIASSFCNQGKQHRKAHRYFIALTLYEICMTYRQTIADMWGVGGAKNQMATVLIKFVENKKDELSLSEDTVNLLLGMATLFNKEALWYYHQKPAPLGYAEVSEYMAIKSFLENDTETAKLFLAENFWWRQKGVVGGAFGVMEPELIPFLNDPKNGLTDKQLSKPKPEEIVAQCFQHGVVDKNDKNQYGQPFDKEKEKAEFNEQTETVAYDGLTNLMGQVWESTEFPEQDEIQTFETERNGILKYWNENKHQIAEKYVEIGKIFISLSSKTKDNNQILMGMAALHYFEFVLYKIPGKPSDENVEIISDQLQQLPKYFNVKSQSDQPLIDSVKEIIDNAQDKYLKEREPIDGITVEYWKVMRHYQMMN